jgi:hypothetical protein
MVRLLVCGLFAAFVVGAWAPSEAMAQKKKKVEIGEKWSGSVDDEKAAKPDCVTTAKGLEALWKAWKAPGDVPKVDFTKNIVVGVYSVGSKLNLASAILDEKGNLDAIGFGTRDIRPGFRYVLGVVSKDGVKTVNRKELPKE